MNLRVGQRLAVTVAYPAPDHRSIPAATGNLLCEVGHADGAQGPEATFLALAPGDALVSATTGPGARAFRPNLTVTVHIRP